MIIFIASSRIFKKIFYKNLRTNTFLWGKQCVYMHLLHCFHLHNWGSSLMETPTDGAAPVSMSVAFLQHRILIFRHKGNTLNITWPLLMSVSSL